MGSLPALGSRARVSVSALARHPAPAPHAPATRRPRGPAQPRNPRRPASRDLPPRARVRSACHLRFLRSVRAVDERGMGTTSSRPAPQHYPVPPVRSKETRARPRPNPREANPAAPALRSPANKKRHTSTRPLEKKLGSDPPQPPRARSRDRCTTASPRPRTTGSSTASLISAPRRNPTTS